MQLLKYLVQRLFLSKPVSALRLCYSMFFHSVFRMNSKFSTFSTIIGIGYWGEDRFLAVGCGFRGAFPSYWRQRSVMKVRSCWISFHCSIWFSTSALLPFGFGVAEVLGGHSSRMVFPGLPNADWDRFACVLPLGRRKRFRWMRGSVSPIGAEDIPFFSCWCVRAAGKTSPLDVATQVFNPPMNCWKQRFPMHWQCCGKLRVFAGGLS